MKLFYKNKGMALFYKAIYACARTRVTLKSAVYGLFFLASIATASAETEWSVRANLHQMSSYDDNFRMSHAPQQVGQYIITPEIIMARRSEQLQLESSASYGMQRYFGISDLNSTIQNYTLKGAYQVAKSIWGLNANLNITPSRNTAGQDSGNFSINAQKTLESINPSLIYQFGANDNLQLNFYYVNTDYSTANFSDNRNLTATAFWEHQWTTHFTNGLQFGFSDFQFSQRTLNSRRKNSASEFANYYFLMTGNYLLAEHWSFGAGLGARFTSNNLNLDNPVSFNSGLLFNSRFSYQGEPFSAQLTTDRSLISSSLGQLQQQTEFKLHLNYTLTQTLSLIFLSSYQQNLLLSTQSHRNSVTLQPSCRWQMLDDWTMTLSYRYRTLKTNAALDLADSNAVILAIDYNWQGLKF